MGNLGLSRRLLHQWLHADIVGDSDELEDADDDTLGRPSVRSSSNLLAPSGCSMTFLYSSSPTSPEVSSKFPTGGGADAGCGTTKISPAPSASPLSYITMRMLALLALCMTRRSGLKLVSSPKTRITPFGALADKECWKKVRSEEHRKKCLGFRTGSTKVNDCGDDHAVYQV